MVKWLWSLIWGKKRRSRRKNRGVLWSLFRWFTPGLTVTGVFAAIAAVLTGQVNLPTLDSFRGTEPPVYSDPITSAVASNASPLQPVGYASARPLGEASLPRKISPVNMPAPMNAGSSKSPTTIKIASFNIQMFGEKKSSNPEIMAQLAAIFLQFDVVAVQEIRGDPQRSHQSPPPGDCLQGGRYQAIHSPKLGRTSQTECYGYVWDQTRIAMVPESNYVLEDSADRMHRQPMVASFYTTFAPTGGRNAFRFTLLNVHTDPDEVRGDSPQNELNVLDDVFQSVRNYEYEVAGEDDFIMLGDLNVDVGGLNELGALPGVVSLIGDIPTNTRKTKTYDHLLIDSRITTEYIRRGGVMDLESFLRLDMESATKVSDHLPVWAEFSVHEAPRAF